MARNNTPESDVNDNCLTDLQLLQINDITRFKECINAGQQQGWAYYFPFLLFVRYGAKNSQMLWTQDHGALCLFVRHTGKENRLALYFPPCPADEAVLRRCLERTNDYNRGHSTWIYWIDDNYTGVLRQLKILRLKRRNPQYLYRPADLAEMAGSTYRTLRRNISLGKRMADIDVQPYQPEDASECQQLLEHWENTQDRKAAGIRYQKRYALNCFQLAPRFHARDLHGLVFRVDGAVRAFTFGGEIRPELGCSLLAIADPDVVCLSYVVRHRFLTGMSDCLLVNDGSDGGQEGLRQMKERFRPCGMHHTFKAKQVAPLPVKIRGVQHWPDHTPAVEAREHSPPYLPTPEDVTFWQLLEDALRAANPSDLNKTAIDRQFARSSFPRQFQRLMLILFAEGHKRILISRSSQDPPLRFSAVLYRLLKHSRRAGMMAAPFRLQMEFMVAPASSVNYAALGTTPTEDCRFEPGRDGLLIYDPDEKLRVFPPGDAYINAVTDTAGVKMYLNQRYGRECLERSRVLRYRVESYISDAEKVWLHLTQGHPLAGQPAYAQSGGKTRRKQAPSPVPYPPARYELRPSQIVPGQVGLFALVPFNAGEVVLPYTLFDETRLITWSELDTIDPVTRGKLMQYCYKNAKGVHAPQNINHISIGYFINHRCDPSLAFNAKGDYIARRAISAGEELTADLEKTAKQGSAQFVCTCQASNCRKIIRV